MNVTAVVGLLSLAGSIVGGFVVWVAARYKSDTASDDRAVAILKEDRRHLRAKVRVLETQLLRCLEDTGTKEDVINVLRRDDRLPDPPEAS